MSAAFRALLAYKGFHFDIGGHRFFSKSKVIEDLWDEILPNDMLHRPRSSRIFYRRKIFRLSAATVRGALQARAILQSALCLLSWFKARLFPVPNPRNFEDWVSNQFGKRLFKIFFKSYTEKVWGMSCREISADWAAQRIKELIVRAAPSAMLSFPGATVCERSSSDQNADQFFSLSAERPRHDVGGGRAEIRFVRREHSYGMSGGRLRTRGRYPGPGGFNFAIHMVTADSSKLST